MYGKSILIRLVESKQRDFLSRVHGWCEWKSHVSLHVWWVVLLWLKTWFRANRARTIKDDRSEQKEDFLSKNPYFSKWPWQQPPRVEWGPSLPSPQLQQWQPKLRRSMREPQLLIGVSVQSKVIECVSHTYFLLVHDRRSEGKVRRTYEWQWSEGREEDDNVDWAFETWRSEPRWHPLKIIETLLIIDSHHSYRRQSTENRPETVE